MYEPTTLYYRNITISGIAGTGTTTLLHRLRETLAPLGWSGYSGGEYMRQFLSEAQQRKLLHHTAQDYDESVDRQMDASVRQQLQDGHSLIIESWLSGFDAQGIPGVLKILLICTNELDRARRLASRDGVEPATAMLEAYKRLEANVGRWSRMYAQEWEEWVVQSGLLPANYSYFFWHPALYDLVIDTAVYDPEAVLELTLDKLGYREPAPG
jgi:cytidylate kinase